ncbi:hypothetical protein HY230_00400 [Candidatus Acetothermia bacterium]|nr:hypothetical protein [Candidatus Acetothermia bacterium]MBI3658921.1 hypothetical protein [Candidatus Acetothermia bacterium]
MTTGNTLPSVPMNPDELRHLFNNGNYYNQVMQGAMSSELRRNGHPSPEKSGEPHCTHSQILAYYDEKGNKVAIVHQYLILICVRNVMRQGA